MKKVIIWTVSIVLVLYIVIECALPGIVMHSFLDQKVNNKKVYLAEESGLPTPDTLHLKSNDNIELFALKVVPETPKAVVVCLTGIEKPSVTCFWGHAKMFYDANYASILLEVRGHAPSGGNRICIGYEETADVKAVTDYIKSNQKLKDIPVVIMGISMGGAIAINSIGNNNDINALISIAAYSAFEDAFVELLDGQIPNIFLYGIKPFVELTSMIRYDVNPLKMCPKRNITRLNNRPALLMHTKKDSNVNFANFERLTKVAPKNIQTMVRDLDEHFFTPDFLNPQSDSIYSNKIMSFIDEAVKL
ncbi:MAG: alpha/beta hydrolase [Bacteroidales bacterium]|nr:alpha/beta hydrolase [Bacteroidales bacterium]